MKSLLLSLFLYVALVWVVAFYRSNGSDASILDFGLRWTIIGLAAVLLFIAASRLLGWWRNWREKSAARPTPPPKPAEIVHEDDAALSALLAEANAKLAKSPAYAGRVGKTPLTRLPLYLLIGPEGSGKTSTFLNSGLEPVLLAGQVAGAAPLVPTRLCNIWLARNAIFAEISGRVFSGDVGRWTQLLRVLRGQAKSPLWRGLWQEPDPGFTLHGVVAFCDVKEFTTASNTQRLERFSREWQERLRAVGEVFSTDFRVYQVIAKCDAITFFPDFFRRLPEQETKQVLGCTLPQDADASRPGEVALEAEIRRLTRSFSPLYYSLTKRRLTHLAHEPDPTKRPGVYEFPREFKRIRSPLVQFLSDVFRPHPLQPGPLLRGYYLTATVEVEAAPAEPGATRADWSATVLGSDATQIFNSDATRLFRPDSSGSKTHAVRSGVTTRWLFASDLFHSVILGDRPARKAGPVVDGRLELYRRAACAAACGVCALLCLGFMWSWTANRELLSDVQARSEFVRKSGRSGLLPELRSLDGLREPLQKLRHDDQAGAPMGMRWGLYSGGRILAPLREAYFLRFQRVLLNDLSSEMVARLSTAPGSMGTDAPYDRTYRVLKTHLMISSGACKAEPDYAARVLKETREEIPALAVPGVRELANRQIDFYASELPFGNPCRLTEITTARDHARQYLRKNTGVQAMYSNILADAEKSLAKRQRLGDLASNYDRVLSGNGDMSAAFTPEGWNFVEKASKVGGGASGESCVMGGVLGAVSEYKQDLETQREIQRMFLRDYAARWRKFVGGFSVVRYNSADDAARKLEILAANNSPLLAVFAMTANQTNFQAKPLEIGIIESAKKKFKKAENEISKRVDPGAADGLNSPADLKEAFQPVHSVVPPASEKWVVEKNNAYIESLAQLRRSMQEIARGGATPDPAVHQAAIQNYEKALDAVQQISRGFKPLGVDGLDGEVKRLLQEPILRTSGFIIRDMDKNTAGKLNGELRAVCSGLSPQLRKYPFRLSTDDLSLADLSKWFGPSGEIWQFHAKSLAELTVKDGGLWKAKDPTKKPQVTPELLTFLNRVQSITNAFFPAGATQPQLIFSLRPMLDPSFGDSKLELEVDGQLYLWNDRLRKQFTWPAPSGTRRLGAIARIRGPVTYPFANRVGPWGIFRVIGDAEPRQLGVEIVEWKYSRVGDAPDPIQPMPVRAVIADSSGGIDVFNPKFFEGLHCPATGVQ